MKKNIETFTPPVSRETAEKKARQILEKMTLEDKLKIIGGTRGFYIQGNSKFGIPEVYMSDASHGLNIRDSWGDDKIDFTLEKSTSFPCLLLLASTWSRDLASDYGKSVGEECRAGGTAILLGPGMNIYRHSQCGRNFEYLGEDPYLVSSLIKKYVVSLQNTGVAATLKHFIANNSDYFRRRSNSIVDNRALHEIYLPAFKTGVDAGAMCVMTSYNLVNGEWSSQSREVITDLLKGELGFEWLVMTDWWAINNNEKAVKSGLDLEMPAKEVLSDSEKLLNEGKIDISDIDGMVFSILKTCMAMNFYRKDFKKPELLERFADHEKKALQIAEEGTILLKNRNSILPLGHDKQVLVTGKFIEIQAKGGGAATVKGYNQKSLLQCLEEEFPGQINYVKDPTGEEISSAHIILLSVGTSDSEGWDRPFELPADEENEIIRIVSGNSNTVVIVNSGSGIRMTSWHEKAAAILYGWYGGQTGTRAMANILSGKVNPSGKLPITIEREFTDSPGYGYIPEGEELYSGWNSGGEEKRAVFDVLYREGIFVGYRWYEKKNIDPLYPFGFGLSYTEFSYSDLSVGSRELQRDEELSIVFKVTNNGPLAGWEIVQIYVEDVECSVERPVKELKSYDKVFLNKDETKMVEITLDKSAFSYWDEKKKSWTLEPGFFNILIGSSSTEIHLKETVKID